MNKFEQVSSDGHQISLAMLVPGPMFRGMGSRTGDWGGLKSGGNMGTLPVARET